MKRIAFYPDGSMGVIDDESKDTVTINGQEPERYEEATKENLIKYFGPQKPEGNITVK